MRETGLADAAGEFGPRQNLAADAIDIFPVRATVDPFP
jgi:hypothetical protein